MNYLEIIILAFIVLLAGVGYWKGFIRKLAAIFSLALSVVLVSVFLPYITDFLKYETPVYSYIETQCHQVITEKIGQAVLPESVRKNANDQMLADQVSTLSLSRNEQTRFIETLPLPEPIREMMLDYNNEEGYRRLSVSSFQDYLINFIATAILNIVSYIGAVVLMQILLRILVAALDILSHLPIIGGINRILGLVLGMAEALFFIWIFFLILSAAVTTDWGTALMSMVQESRLLTFLYDSNLFLQIVLTAATVFV